MRRVSRRFVHHEIIIEGGSLPASTGGGIFCLASPFRALSCTRHPNMHHARALSRRDPDIPLALMKPWTLPGRAPLARAGRLSFVMRAARCRADPAVAHLSSPFSGLHTTLVPPQVVTWVSLPGSGIDGRRQPLARLVAMVASEIIPPRLSDSSRRGGRDAAQQSGPSAHLWKNDGGHDVTIISRQINVPPPVSGLISGHSGLRYHALHLASAFPICAAAGARRLAPNGRRLAITAQLPRACRCWPPRLISLRRD